MPNLYIEARPKDRPEGSATDDFVVDHVLATFKTKKEAINRARKKNHSPLVARVRHLNDEKIPDHGAPPSLNGTRFLSGRSFGAT
jgi:hypothetical protein